jgi:hypothetical protein
MYKVLLTVAALLVASPVLAVDGGWVALAGVLILGLQTVKN